MLLLDWEGDREAREAVKEEEEEGRVLREDSGEAEAVEAPEGRPAVMLAIGEVETGLAVPVLEAVAVALSVPP